MQLKLLLTGSELMTGDTVDSNSAMIATMCLDKGIQVSYKATVSDDLAQLISEIERISQTADVLIVNGGLGPTSDDLTSEALAVVLDSPLAFHLGALAHLNKWCAERNYELSDANKKQALLPKCVDLVANSVGSAVGFKAVHNDCLIICTPGVPSELDIMLKEQILPTLSARLASDVHPKRVRFRVFGYGESNLQQQITETFSDWPAEVELGFRASLPLLEVKLKVDYAAHHALLDLWKTKIQGLLGDHIVTEDARPIAQVVVELLAKNGHKVTSAESCTGGKIASLLTQISGSSQVFEAGFVTYSNAMKVSMLGVSELDLNSHGAVSETVVRQMLSGALKHSGADIGVAVSGVAGPNGGTDEKPVGTVWLAWGRAENISARAFYFPTGRAIFQKIVSALALDLIRRELLGSIEQPAYFVSRQAK